MLESLHYTLDMNEVKARLGAKDPTFQKALDAGNCVGCGASMFCQETTDNVLVLSSSAVVHVCDACKPKLVAPAKAAAKKGDA